MTGEEGASFQINYYCVLLMKPFIVQNLLTENMVTVFLCRHFLCPLQNWLEKEKQEVTFCILITSQLSLLLEFLPSCHRIHWTVSETHPSWPEGAASLYPVETTWRVRTDNHKSHNLLEDCYYSHGTHCIGCGKLTSALALDCSGLDPNSKRTLATFVLIMQ